MADMIETKKKKQRTDRHIPLRMYYEVYYSFRRHCRDTEAQQAFEASYAYHNELLALLPLARDKLKEVSLKLNEHKTYLQPIRHGLKTCGCFAYPDRVYVSNRVVNNAWQTMLYYNDHLRGDAIRFCQRMNSYFGTLSHFKTYRIRKELVHLVPTEWWDKVYVEGHYEKFAIRKNNQLKKSQ